MMRNWNTDSQGKRILIQKLGEQYTVVGGKFILNDIPDFHYKINIASMIEIAFATSISSANQYKVNYDTGEVFLDSSKEGLMITVSSYYSTGKDILYNIETNRKSKQIDVTDYGARGDGVTDDTSAVNTALALAQTINVNLFFPAGTYLVDSINYGTKSYANTVSLIGSHRRNTTIKKRTADGIPLLTISASTTVGYTSNLTIKNITFDGLDKTTPAALRIYNLVWTTIEDCEFKNAAVGLDMYGGISNDIKRCNVGTCNYGIKFQTYTYGEPNLNNIIDCIIGNNTSWGLWFDGGRMINIKGCDIENNGTVSTFAGGVYIGNGSSGLTGHITIASSIEECWFEGNSGDSQVYLLTGKNTVSRCIFFDSQLSATYDIHIYGGRYHIDNCDAVYSKTSNIKEESGCGIGNFIINCDFVGLGYNVAKTMLMANNQISLTGVTLQNAWNGGHIILGTYHLWIDAGGLFRLKNGQPTSDTDGTIIGTQT